MKRSARVLASLLLISVCSVARPGAAVVGGTPFADATADGVVMVVSIESECSGALIAPTVVLTAAQCLSKPLLYRVLGGLNPLIAPLFSIGVSEVHRHPDYDPNVPAHDVGVAILADPAPATPLPWLPTDAGFYVNGTPVGILGYGVTGLSAMDSGIRRSGSTTISDVYAGQFLTNNMTGQGMCAGDAGGPAITTDEINPGSIIGVSTFGGPDCAEYSAFERTDANAAFIALYAPEPGAVAGVEIAFGALLLLARRRG